MFPYKNPIQLPSFYFVFVTQYVELPLQKGQMFVENMVILCMKTLALSYLISKYLDVNQGANLGWPYYSIMYA